MVEDDLNGFKRVPAQFQEKLTIEVNLAKYQLFASNAEITFTIESADHKGAIDQLIEAIHYWSQAYDKDLVIR